MSGRLSPCSAQPSDTLAAGFHNVPAEARMRMFWRIFGPAWAPPEIDYQLALLKEAGVGGVMTCFTYPAALNDPQQGIQNEPFLSSAFLDTLGYAARKAQQEGLAFGICGGSGWPYGGPSVTIADAAQHLRMETPPRLPEGNGWQPPKLRAGEQVVAAFIGPQEVTASLHNGRLEGREAAGPCRVFIAGPTAMQVKRAALGAEGYVIDHFSWEATRRYLDAVVAPMLQAAPAGAPIRSVFCDSLEVYNADWTHDFPAQFRKRRGYDLIPHLPELFDDRSPLAPDLRFDFWRTLAELTEQEFAQTVYAWCREHHVAFVLEAYGTPSMGFTGARWCDVPWGEQYEWKGFSFSRFAASGAHLAGKKIIGAEAWTWAGIPDRLADTLSDLKLCSDLHFLAGENELTGVDFPYSPRSAGAPGWLPYYGPVLNANNPQWLCFPELAAYVNRCQWLLRQGAPVADIALYTPTEDIFAEGPPGQMLLDFRLRDRFVTGAPTDEFGLEKALRHHSDLISTLLQHGYDFDGIDFFAINALARVQRRELVAGDGRYHVVILPDLKGIDRKALEKIAQFCRAGGVVIAVKQLPTRAYGLQEKAETPHLQTLLAAMFGPVNPEKGVQTHAYGKGRAIFTPDAREGLAQALRASGVGPDMRLAPLQAEVSQAHRRVGERDLYFVANVGGQEAEFSADFRVGAKAVTRWDPLQGTIAPLPATATEDGYTRVTLRLPPRGSTFLCFAPGRPDAVGAPPSPHRERTQPLETTWQIRFEGPDAPPPYATHQLNSWTEWPGARFFSGRVTYTGAFTLTSESFPEARLRFPQVREVAIVAVNGTRVGAVWTPPYELEIGKWLRPGRNTLQITVANLPVNRVLGLPDPDLRALRAVYGNRFPAPEEKRILQNPLPSGLIGNPVLITREPERAP